jgi:hypothetical protein
MMACGLMGFIVVYTGLLWSPRVAGLSSLAPLEMESVALVSTLGGVMVLCSVVSTLGGGAFCGAISSKMAANS